MGQKMQEDSSGHLRYKPAVTLESILFPLFFFGFFLLFVRQMGIGNTLNTMMNTAYRLLMDTVFYLMAISVLMGAFAALFSEFGFVALVNRLLAPLMGPLYGMPGAAALGVVTTYLSDNPAILALADDQGFRHYFQRYQIPALTNLGTAFGMGMVIAAFMLGLESKAGFSMQGPVLAGTLGAVAGSIVSTRMMLWYTARHYGKEAVAAEEPLEPVPREVRLVHKGPVPQRIMLCMLEGGKHGVHLGFSIVPGILVICTFIMMLSNHCPEGGYTGAAYEGIGLLPRLLEQISFLIKPLFGFSSAENCVVPVTALGAAGAAIGLIPNLMQRGSVHGNDIAVFVAMCMCWSGYLSTHVSMMSTLKAEEMTGASIFCHTIGGLSAGLTAHLLAVFWL